MDHEGSGRQRSDHPRRRRRSRPSRRISPACTAGCDTNSNGSVRESRYYLQMAGAEARERLLLAAAADLECAAIGADRQGQRHHPRAERAAHHLRGDGREGGPDHAAQSGKIRIKGPEQFTLIGTEQKNRDVPLKVTGKAVYGIDVDLPGMLYAAVKACPVFGGKLKSYDFDAVKDRPASTRRSRSRARAPGPTPIRNGGSGIPVCGGGGGRRQLVAGQDRARSDADRMGSADPMPARTSEDMLQADFETLKQPGTIVLEEGGSYARSQGEGRQGGGGDLHHAVPAHARMEPGNATAMVTADRVDVWTGDQSPQFGLLRAADEAGVTPDKVFVHTTFLGGGYRRRRRLRSDSPGHGHRQDLERHGPSSCCGRARRTCGWARNIAPWAIAQFEAALDAEAGRWPSACTTSPISMTAIPYGSAPTNRVAEGTVRGLDELPYFVPTFFFDVHTKNSHVPVGFRRSSGSAANVFYLESFVDELAHAAGKDPYEYRRELIARNKNIPQPRGLARGARPGGADVGLGHAAAAGLARGISIDDHRHTGKHAVAICAHVVTVSMTRGGVLRLERVDVVFDEGFSFVNPLAVRKQIEGQIAWALSDAMWQEITIKDGRTVEGNFDVYQVARMADYPPEVNIRFLKSNNKWILGVGDEAISHDRARLGPGDLQDHRQAHPLASVRQAGPQLGLARISMRWNIIAGSSRRSRRYCAILIEMAGTGLAMTMCTINPNEKTAPVASAGAIARDPPPLRTSGTAAGRNIRC